MTLITHNSKTKSISTNTFVCVFSENVEGNLEVYEEFEIEVSKEMVSTE